MLTVEKIMKINSQDYLNELMDEYVIEKNLTHVVAGLNYGMAAALTGDTIFLAADLRWKQLERLKNGY